MPYRRILLRIMLWSLGIGALLGAAAVFMNGGSAYWRISGTTFMTAVAAGLLIPISRLVDRSVTRPSGLLGMSVLIGEFLLGLAAIWLGDFISNWSFEALAMTMFFLPVCGIAACVFLRAAMGDARGQWPGRVGLVLSIVCFLMLLAGAWLANVWAEREEMLGSAGVLGGFGLVAILCMANTASAPRFRGLLILGRTLGLLASMAATAIALYAIWYHIRSDSDLFRIISSLAIFIAYANLCLLVPLTAVQSWFRWITIAAAFCTAACLDLALSKALARPEIAFAERGASAAGIITACGSLALVVLARMNRRVSPENRELVAVSEVRIFCPGCESKQLLPVGRSECPTCHLKFEIHVEEPRCPQCDYLLFMLKSDRCPECGWAINSASAGPRDGAPNENSATSAAPS